MQISHYGTLRKNSACSKMAEKRSLAVSPASSNISTTKSKIPLYVATKVPVLSQNYKSVEAEVMVLLKKQKALCEYINTGKGKAEKMEKMDCDDRGENNKEEQKPLPVSTRRADMITGRQSVKFEEI